MPIIISAIAVLITTAVFRLGNEILKIKVCPICAGTSLTWIGLTAGVLLGILAPTSYLSPIIIMMGGTAVGIAYQAEKKFPWAASLAGKSLIIASGFILVYFFINNLGWPSLIAETFLLLVLGYFLFIKGSGQTQTELPAGEKETARAKVGELEEKIEECC